MAQNRVQSTDALFTEDQIVYIADYSSNMTNDSLVSLTNATWTNIGSLTEFGREAAIETVQPPSQNCEHEQQVASMKENVNVTIQELSQTNYNKMLGGTAQAVTVAGSSTSTTESYTTGNISTSIERFYPFAEQNWSSTSASIPVTPENIIIDGSSTYLADQDYLLLQNEDYYFGFAIQSTGAHTSTSTLGIAYDFAPKAQNILYHGGADELTPIMMKVYSIYSDGRTITTYYPRVEYQSGGAVADKGANSGEFKDMAFSLQAREHEFYTYSGRKQYKVEVQTTA